MPRHLHWDLPETMINFRVMPFQFLLLTSCGAAGNDNPNSNSGHPAAIHTVSEPRVHITATYNAAVLPNHVTINIQNDETFPVCFSSNDILPGSETTVIRDSRGQILSGSRNEALEEFRGINLASPVVVLRPGRSHSELLDLEEYNISLNSIVLQIGFAGYRCSNLFNDTTSAVQQTYYQKVFRVAGNRISDEPRLRFEMGEEPPASH
jgi:hypothetical protein